MQNNYASPRLLLDKLALSDAGFIYKLVNTPGWIQFIGDRNIKSIEDATGYIQKITDNPDINYWVVRIRDTQIPVGVITFIKRSYLDHHDIGFAFLPEHTRQGYAYEAAVTVLNDVIKDPAHTHILATTVKENISSIQLLEKMGLRYSNEIQIENEALLVYAAATDKLCIDHLTKIFFRLFTNANQRNPDLGIIHEICLPEAIIIKKTGLETVVYDPHSFIEPRRIILSDGTLTGFEEWETNEETKVAGNIAQRHSQYQKRGYLNGVYFEGGGNKFFRFIKTADGWKISSLTWEDNEN